MHDAGQGEKLNVGLDLAALMELRARATLRLVLLMPEVTVAAAKLESPLQCPNCGVPAPSTKSPYCSAHCRELASFVRQLRAGLNLGWIELSDKQVALGQNLWYLLGGGRPLRQGLVPPKAVERVHARTEGRCEGCGGEASTVDHPRSACNRTINLRAVCETCSTDRPFGSEEVLGSPNAKKTLNELRSRVHSPNAVLECDDAESWDWRAFLDQRKTVLPPH